MDERSWSDCIEQNKASNVTIDRAKARSLIETAIARKAHNASQRVTPESANFIFEAEYSSLLELLHARCILDGFKVTNHACIGFYLRDKLKREDLFRTFDKCRYRRNSLVYYGKHMDFETAKEAIAETRELQKEAERWLA